MNLPKVEFIAFIVNFYIEIIHNLGDKTILYLIFNRINGFVGVQTAIVNTDSQWSKQEACFARATQVWLAVNHNINITSGEWIWCSKGNAGAGELGSCQ